MKFKLFFIMFVLLFISSCFFDRQIPTGETNILPEYVLCNINGYTYCSDSTDYNFYIKEYSNFGDGVKYCDNSTGIEYCLIYQPSDISYRDVYGSQDYISSISYSQGIVNETRITYSNIFPNIDLSYNIFKRDVKETYTINTEPRSPAAYLGENISLSIGGYIKYGNLEVWANGAKQTGDFKTDGIIEFRIGNVALFHLPEPYAVNTSGNISSNLTYEVKNQGGQIWFYLNIPYWYIDNTTYPIKIDPPIGASPTATDWMFFNNNAGSNMDVKYFNGSVFTAATSPGATAQDRYTECLSYSNHKIICSISSGTNRLLLFQVTNNTISTISSINVSTSSYGSSDVGVYSDNTKAVGAVVACGSTCNTLGVGWFNEDGTINKSEVVQTSTDSGDGYMRINELQIINQTVGSFSIIGTTSSTLKEMFLLVYNGTEWVVNTTLTNMSSQINEGALECPDVGDLCYIHYSNSSGDSFVGKYVIRNLNKTNWELSSPFIPVLGTTNFDNRTNRGEHGLCAVPGTNLVMSVTAMYAGNNNGYVIVWNGTEYLPSFPTISTDFQVDITGFADPLDRGCFVDSTNNLTVAWYRRSNNNKVIYFNYFNATDKSWGYSTISSSGAWGNYLNPTIEIQSFKTSQNVYKNETVLSFVDINENVWSGVYWDSDLLNFSGIPQNISEGTTKTENEGTQQYEYVCMDEYVAAEEEEETQSIPSLNGSLVLFVPFNESVGALEGIDYVGSIANNVTLGSGATMLGGTSGVRYWGNQSSGSRSYINNYTTFNVTYPYNGIAFFTTTTLKSITVGAATTSTFMRIWADAQSTFAIASNGVPFVTIMGNVAGSTGCSYNMTAHIDDEVHLGYVYKPANAVTAIWIDGVNVCNITTNNAWNDNFTGTQASTVGHGNQDNFLNATMKNMRLYLGYNLTDADIAAIYAEDVPPQASIYARLSSSIPSIYYKVTSLDVKNLEPNGQSSTVPLFNITNNGTLTVTVCIWTNATYPNVYEECSTDYFTSAGMFNLTTTPQAIKTSVTPDENFGVWCRRDYYNPIEKVKTSILFNATTTTCS